MIAMTPSLNASSRPLCIKIPRLIGRPPYFVHPRLPTSANGRHASKRPGTGS
eukprot:gene41519-65613_t